jgi:oxygen-independent coproporphyrinogen-3 oxidase
MRGEDTGVYVHIPFCTGVCSYCHYARVSDMPHMVGDYLNALKEELRLHEHYGGKIRADSLYLGGGTPTYLNGKKLFDLIDCIQGKVEAEDDIEVTVEASPETLSKEKLDVLKKAGVNRLSIGVQAFDDHLLLNVCRRRHNKNMAVKAVQQAKNSDFDNGVNIDLIYGLPDQTLEVWSHTLDTVEEISPEFVTTYHLRIKKGTRLSATPRHRFPSEHDTWLMYVTAIERLTDNGCIQIAPNQFAKKGFCFRHQEHKWRNKELLGVGVSAYGYVNNTVYHNVRSLQDYGDTVHKGHLPVHIGKRLSEREQMTRAMIFGLKLSGVNRPDGGLEKHAFRKDYGMRVEDVFRETLKKLRELGLVRIGRRFVQLTYKGILFSDEVCREFYSREEKEYLKKIGHTYGRGVF